MEPFITMESGFIALRVILLTAVALTAIRYFHKKERLPDVEFLRASNKPGKAGGAEDVQAFLSDSLGAIMKGYNEVWR
jgi:hypothetical protein